MLIFEKPFAVQMWLCHFLAQSSIRCFLPSLPTLPLDGYRSPCRRILSSFSNNRKEKSFTIWDIHRLLEKKRPPYGSCQRLHQDCAQPTHSEINTTSHNTHPSYLHPEYKRNHQLPMDTDVSILSDINNQIINLQF